MKGNSSCLALMLFGLEAAQVSCLQFGVPNSQEAIPSLSLVNHSIDKAGALHKYPAASGALSVSGLMFPFHVLPSSLSELNAALFG